jgi:glycosyltransferase involved in cell wall biosynthesis
MAEHEILVSVVCITYNHENFISQAIDSFLYQKTNFRFEIIIHDDASTDKTLEIINEYANDHPDVIKIINQSVNQYSQGKRVYPIALEYCKGNFIAFCDGDDYWISQNKLQLQVDVLNKNLDSDLCFHNSFKLLQNGKLKNFNSGFNKIYFSDIKSLFSKTKINTKSKSNLFFKVPTEKIIVRGGEFMHTGSLLIRSRALKPLPDFLYSSAVSDYYLQILGSIRGGAVQLNQPMSCYRAQSSRLSWSVRMDKYENRKEWYDATIETNHLMNRYLKYKFDKSFMIINANCFCHMAIYYLRLGMFKNYYNLVLDSRNFPNNKDKVYCFIYYLTSPIILIIIRLNNFIKTLNKTN